MLVIGAAAVNKFLSILASVNHSLKPSIPNAIARN